MLGIVSADSVAGFERAASRIYGAGESYAVQLLRQFNKEMDEATAKRRAADLYLSTKGPLSRTQPHPLSPLTLVPAQRLASTPPVLSRQPVSR